MTTTTLVGTPDPQPWRSLPVWAADYLARLKHGMPDSPITSFRLDHGTLYVKFDGLPGEDEFTRADADRMYALRAKRRA